MKAAPGATNPINTRRAGKTESEAKAIQQGSRTGNAGDQEESRKTPEALHNMEGWYSMIVYFKSLATGQCYFGKELPGYSGYVEITEGEWLAWYKSTF